MYLLILSYLAHFFTHNDSYINKINVSLPGAGKLPDKLVTFACVTVVFKPLVTLLIAVTEEPAETDPRDVVELEVIVTVATVVLTVLLLKSI